MHRHYAGNEGALFARDRYKTVRTKKFYHRVALSRLSIEPCINRHYNISDRREVGGNVSQCVLLLFEGYNRGCFNYD